jgi:hypothetical protein
MKCLNGYTAIFVSGDFRSPQQAAQRSLPLIRDLRLWRVLDYGGRTARARLSLASGTIAVPLKLEYCAEELRFYSPV